VALPKGKAAVVVAPKGGPTVDDVKKVELVTKQAKKLENFTDLERKSTKSKTLENNNTTPLEMLGYRPTYLQKAFRKRKKKNKIHLQPIR
jgi:Holliday junction resolvasome RuvABC DNA-binding subunit